MKRIFSGIQPSGGIMLGNYLGALKSWVRLQSEYDCMYCIVDLHSITVKQDPNDLLERTFEALAVYLASGIDPDKSVLFVQSQVAAHAELSWILTCFTAMGELSRMTQFKDKSAKQKTIGTGLFVYPVLMASDILLYQSHLVPVGQDQKQHLELVRDLAERMNSLYRKDLFIVPEAFIPPIGARIMSLQDPKAKMSKSDPDPNATVFLSDSDDTIVKKIKRAVTDSGSEVTYEENKPGVQNLIHIQSAITEKNPDEIVSTYAGKQYGHLKVDTANIVLEALKPIREKYQSLLKDKQHLKSILERGAETANTRAEITMKNVKQAIGLVT